MPGGSAWTSSRWPRVYSGQTGQDLDFLFVHHQEVDRVEQALELAGSRGGIEDDECTAALRNPRGLPDQFRPDPQLQDQDISGPYGVESGSMSAAVSPALAPGLTMIWFSPWSSTAMIAVPVAARAAYPHVADVDVGLGEDLKDPTTMRVATDCAGEFHRGPGPCRSDGLISALAAGAKRRIRAPDGFPQP